jgi:hypothetical protein
MASSWVRPCVALLALAPEARALDVPCSGVEPGVIHVDGLLDDWSEVAGLDVGGRDRDFSFTAKCNYDEKTLYLAIDVRDDYLVRSKDTRPNEDHIEIAFADGAKVDRLIVYPTDDAAKAKRVVKWSSGRKLKGIEVADAKQPAGWAVELAFALASVPGWSPGAPLIKLGIGAYDCDSKATPKIEATLETSQLTSPPMLGTVEFAEGKQALDAFLRDRRLSPRDVIFDRPGKIGARGSVRVVVAPPFLATISDEYAYVTLPIRDRKDVKEARLVDLAGDGREALLLRYVERGGGGVREVLGAFRVTGDGLRRTFGVEVAKQQGTNQLVTKVSLVKKGRATEILVEPKPAVGWTEATYRESPADDLVPIPTPWGAVKRARFQFKGENYFRAE